MTTFPSAGRWLGWEVSGDACSNRLGAIPRERPISYLVPGPTGLVYHPATS